MKRIVYAVVVGLVVASALWMKVTPSLADTPPPTPLTASEQDRLTIAVLAKDNAEKGVRLAVVDLQRASENLDKAMRELQVAGSVIQQNPQTGKFERVKAPPAIGTK